MHVGTLILPQVQGIGRTLGLAPKSRKGLQEPSVSVQNLSGYKQEEPRLWVRTQQAWNHSLLPQLCTLVKSFLPLTSVSSSVKWNDSAPLMKSLWSPDDQMSLRVLGPVGDGAGFQWEGWAQGGGTPGPCCLLEKWLEGIEDPSRARSTQ